MTFDEATAELKDATKNERAAADAAPARSTTPRILQTARDLCALVALIAFVLSLVSYRGQAAETAKAKAQSACINRILNDRNGTSANDEAAHAAYASATSVWAQSVASLVAIPATASDQDRQVVVAAFIAETATYAQQTAQYSATLKADQDYRASHPLGAC